METFYYILFFIANIFMSSLETKQTNICITFPEFGFVMTMTFFKYSTKIKTSGTLLKNLIHPTLQLTFTYKIKINKSLLFLYFLITRNECIKVNMTFLH